jgi:SAM-dependent methyltransferase
MSQWHEDDAFWKAFYPVMFSDARWAVAEGEVQSVLSLLGVTEPLDVLDFCCGPGRHTIAMAKLGHRVLGVDRTEYYLQIGRQRAEEAGVDLVFEQGDVRTFRRAEGFDCAVSLFTSFGYFDDPADDLKVLENVYASLRPGGKLLMDLSGKEVVAKAFTQRGWSEPEPGLVWLEERKVLPGWAGIENKWTLMRGESKFEHVLSIRLYSGIELRSALLGVGFSRVDFFGSLDGDPYDHSARRLVAVGVK